MAKIWFVYEGRTRTVGDPAYELPLDTCIKQLGLDRHQWLSDLDDIPRFEEQVRGLGMIAGYKHVVCEVGEDEATKGNWRAGFYRLEIETKEVIRRLGPPASSVPDRIG
jgi:hypothetical protein